MSFEWPTIPSDIESTGTDKGTTSVEETWFSCRDSGYGTGVPNSAKSDPCDDVVMGESSSLTGRKSRDWFAPEYDDVVMAESSSLTGRKSQDWFIRDYDEAISVRTSTESDMSEDSPSPSPKKDEAVSVRTSTESDRSEDTPSPSPENDEAISVRTSTESDRSEDTLSPSPENDEAISVRTSTESDRSEDTLSPSPENDTWLIVAHAKHRMILSLMRDVYTIFNPQWKPDLRSHAGDRAASTGAHAYNSSSRTPPSTGNSKRRLRGWDSPPPDENDSKKRKTKSPTSGDDEQERLFACCFHKHNAQKYCSNRDTGSKYRSCAGPGFSKISKLKQHLKRIHRAPIHCPRCWLVLESHAAMSVHANAEERCEQQEPQIIDGVDEDKMRLITETWGISWEGIYEILFPGAPIPSPYYEAQSSAPDILQPSSPGSRQLRDFETYNRTALPLLVEANLRAMVESEAALIEERVRAMVVDVVRTAQSTIARNFRHTIAPISQAHDRIPSSPQESSLNENTTHIHEEPIQSPAYGIAGNSLDSFRVPSLLTDEASASLPTTIYDPSDSITHQSQSQDSGYGTLNDPCNCLCHYPSTWDTTMGQSHCAACGCSLSHYNFDDFDIESYLNSGPQ